mgnify:CR=1 FL=1
MDSFLLEYAGFVFLSKVHDLSQDQKDLVDLAFSTFNGTEEQQRVFSEAVRNASAIADPYARTQIALFNAEYGISIAKTINNYEEQHKLLTNIIKDLADTLKLNVDNLTLEEQSEIAKINKAKGELLKEAIMTISKKDKTFEC